MLLNNDNTSNATTTTNNTLETISYTTGTYTGLINPMYDMLTVSAEPIIRTVIGDTEEIPGKITTRVSERCSNIKVGVYKNDRLIEEKTIMPLIKDIKTINDTVVIVYFGDGTTEKAVLNREDKFSFEQGISICLIKKMLSMISDNHGSSVYNKMIKHCFDIYNKNRESEKEKAAKKELAKIKNR